MTLTQPQGELDKDWLIHPSARDFKNNLCQAIVDIKDEWARGSLTTDNASETLRMNAHALGMIFALEAVLEYFTAETTNEEMQPQ
jgi:hypothetical protein